MKRDLEEVMALLQTCGLEEGPLKKRKIAPATATTAPASPTAAATRKRKATDELSDLLEKVHVSEPKPKKRNTMNNGAKSAQSCREPTAKVQPLKKRIVVRELDGNVVRLVIDRDLALQLNAPGLDPRSLRLLFTPEATEALVTRSLNTVAVKQPGTVTLHMKKSAFHEILQSLVAAIRDGSATATRTFNAISDYVDFGESFSDYFRRLSAGDEAEASQLPTTTPRVEELSDSDDDPDPSAMTVD